MISTQIININSIFKVDYNRDIDLGECSFCSVVVPSQPGLVHWDAAYMIRIDYMKII